jgi:hypothetical protein
VSKSINLKELERKAWRSVFQDGLWDIYLGLLFRKKTARGILAISVLVGAVVFVFTWLATKGNWSEGLPLRIILPAVWAVNMLVVFSLGAYFLDFDRLYLIGVMYALPVPVDFLLNELAGIDLGFVVFAVPAAVILIMGLVVLVRFLRDCPLLAEEVPPAEEALRGNP